MELAKPVRPSLKTGKTAVETVSRKSSTLTAAGEPEKSMKWKTAQPAFILWTASFLWGCSPTVKFEAPDKPIEINMNIKIDHEIRLKVEKDVNELITNQKGLF